MTAPKPSFVHHSMLLGQKLLGLISINLLQLLTTEASAVVLALIQRISTLRLTTAALLVLGPPVRSAAAAVVEAFVVIVGSVLEVIAVIIVMLAATVLIIGCWI
ncbi:MAG: hypothetical protein EZS28_013090 [Streblomastix strix]|uniref:Uncharacterized protein n=1 Tax=Streblomastix strix TaxID=222440 RepID=A0A5J4W937_9EUKA|nr:MAG: hypothetical protein EZS28_013090 [Streblomastix strix]